MSRHDDTITIREGFLFWSWPVTYRGSCTVWRNVETGRRAKTHIEATLFEIWAKKHRKP